MNGPAQRTGQHFEPWRRRGGDQLDARRRELFALAAPVFRRHGYRDATIKALAHACHLSPAGLYHYFSSKRDLATYLVRRPRLDWDSTWVNPSIDAVSQLSQLVDLAIVELPNYLLALQLTEEAGDGRSGGGTRSRAFQEGEAVFGRLIAAAAPGLQRARATEIAREILALLAGTAYTGLDRDPNRAVRARIAVVLRRELVPDLIDADRFGAAFETE
ncbi:MAG: helix-turn-helix domain-containing protein [Chloroflexota bacterium]